MNAVLNDAHVTAWREWLARLEAQLWTLDGFNSHVSDWLAQLPTSHERKQQEKQYEDAFLVFEKIDELLERRRHLESAVKSESPLGIEAADRLISKLDEEVRTLYLSIGLGPDVENPALPVVANIAPDSMKLAISKKWTPEKLAELKSFRDKNGTKKTAEHFDISEQLIRKKLPGEKPRPKGYSAFTHRME